MNKLLENNDLTKFLIFFNFKLKKRRKYVEYKKGIWSITQEYNDDIITIRKKTDIGKYPAYLGSIFYRNHYTSSNVNIILKYIIHFLNENNDLRKYKIKKLLKQ